jgi:Cu/Ag efflux protein CusF
MTPLQSRTLLALAAAFALAGPGLAADSDMVDAEVRKVDRAAGKLTLRHGEIKSLDMPPMTMVFVARDVALLEGLKAGDRIRFRAVNEGGKVTVTAIRPVP